MYFQILPFELVFFIVRIKKKKMRPRKMVEQCGDSCLVGSVRQVLLFAIQKEGLWA